MSIVGVGLDLIDLSRFEILYGGDDPALLDRCFTAQELADAGDGVDRLARLAARFAAKEAVLKVIGGLKDGMALTDIEVSRLADGAPSVALTGMARTCAETLGIARIHISLTHSAASAAAVAIAASD